MTATARRGHSEGSVYRDTANGTWVGAISLGWRPDGSRIRRKVTGRTKTEIRQRLTTADHHGGCAMRCGVISRGAPLRIGPEREARPENQIEPLTDHLLFPDRTYARLAQIVRAP